VNSQTIMEAIEAPTAAAIAAGVLCRLDAMAAQWATAGSRHAARDNLVRAVGFHLMRDAFHGAHAADAGFDLVDAVERLATLANRMSFIDPEIHDPDAVANDICEAARQVARDLNAAWGVKG
jgi:hypothetical protein